VSEPVLLRQHAAVLFRMDGDARLIGLNEPGDEPAPRMFLVRGRVSRLVWFRADVPDRTVEACRVIVDQLPPCDGEQPDRSLFELLRVALARDVPIESEESGPAFRFGERVGLPRGHDVQLIDETSAHLLERYFPYTRAVLASRRPVVGAIVDGWVVVACFSARSRPAACEAGVATEEQFRGRGLAPLVVSAWRDALEREDRMPLYSTSWGNRESRRVARKLRLILYADTLSLT
jgi:hypothetical protein